MTLLKPLAILTLLLAAPALAADPPRQHLSFDLNWSFIKGDPANASSIDFDDKAWRPLDVPHDWSIEGPYAANNPTGPKGGFVPAGIAWYRKHFASPASPADHAISIQFDGVYMNAEVFLNGHSLGVQPYGYTTFNFDLNSNLAPVGKDNVIAVRVDNTVQPNSRWYTGSGIYRHVWLDVVNPVHVATRGTYVSASKISTQSAAVQIHTTVENTVLVGAGEITVAQEIIGPDGKSAGSIEGRGLINRAAAGNRAEFDQSIIIPQPWLWSPEKPSMYAMRTRVSVGGNLVDTYETPFGIRDLRYDVNQGLFVNGKHTKVLGMCLHQDGGATGVAVPIEIWERRLKLLKEMGCNAVRCSHNPPAPEFLDLCDRLGVMVMDEAFDEWTVTKDLKGSYATLFNQWSQKDLTAMLMRDRNHPSIIMWSIGNEIPQQSTDLGVSIAKTLADTCHALDPTRPVTSACDNVHSPEPTRPEFLAALDIAGYNYVDRWGDHREIFFSDDREAFPQRKFVGTEDVCVGGIRGDYFAGLGQIPTQAPRNAATPFPYASNMIRAEQLWKFNAVHGYVIGYFMWTGIDYLGEAGAWPRKGANSGVLDTCGFPKDGYYFYQSQWTSAPMVHVFPHWNVPVEKGTVIPVVVYSNCQNVELLLNGKSLGVKSLIFPRPGSTRSWNDPTPTGTTADLHLTWDVPFEPGTLTAIGRRNGQIAAREEIHTAGEPASIALRLDKTALSPRGVAQVEVRILDAAGNIVPTADTLLTFDLSGPAKTKILALDNGDQSSHEPYQSNQRHAFNGMALAILQAGPMPGHVKLTARAEKLKDAAVELDVQEK